MPAADSHRTKVPGTKYRARFSADIDELVALIGSEKPDVVVANQIEEAPAVRTALLEAGSDALLAGYCHYLPFSFAGGGQMLLDPSLDDAGLGRPVLLVFAAGLAACDRVMVHSSTAASWVSAAAARMTVDLGDRLRVVPAPRDERLVRDPATLRAASGTGGAIGVYNHRLYAHYGTEQFVDLARRLSDSSAVRPRVMDLFGQRRAERKASADPWRAVAWCPGPRPRGGRSGGRLLASDRQGPHAARASPHAPDDNGGPRHREGPYGRAHGPHRRLGLCPLRPRHARHATAPHGRPDRAVAGISRCSPIHVPDVAGRGA